MKPVWKARELTVEMIVGAFVVMVFLGLGYFTIILSRETWFSKKQTMEVVFNDVMGLRDGDGVVVRGMTVGKVQELHLEDDGVHVKLTLDKPLHMKKDYRITIVSTSILGGRYLQVYEGTMEYPDMPADSYMRGREPYDVMADAAEVMNAIKSGVVEGGIVENLKDMMAQMKEVSSRLSTGKGTLGKLLSADETLYNDFASAVASLKTISQRLEKGEGSLGKLLGSDDTMYRDLSATAASLRAITTRLEKGEGMLGKLMSSDDKMYADIASASASLKTISERIEKGEGTVGRLMRDETLYTNLLETVNDAKATIDDFREASPVTTFSSIFFGAF